MHLPSRRSSRLRGHHVEREVAVMVYYRGKPLARQVMDMVVDHRIIIDNKVTDRRWSCENHLKHRAP